MQNLHFQKNFIVLKKSITEGGNKFMIIITIIINQDNNYPNFIIIVFKCLNFFASQMKLSLSVQLYLEYTQAFLTSLQQSSDTSTFFSVPGNFCQQSLKYSFKCFKMFARLYSQSSDLSAIFNNPQKHPEKIAS